MEKMFYWVVSTMDEVRPTMTMRTADNVREGGGGPVEEPRTVAVMWSLDWARERDIKIAPGLHPRTLGGRREGQRGMATSKG